MQSTLCAVTWQTCQRWRCRQRVLKNMSDLSPETKLFNETLSHAVVSLHLSVCAVCIPPGSSGRRQPLDAKAFRLRFPRYPCPIEEVAPTIKRPWVSGYAVFCAIIGFYAQRAGNAYASGGLLYAGLYRRYANPGARYRDAPFRDERPKCRTYAATGGQSPIHSGHGTLAWNGRPHDLG